VDGRRQHFAVLSAQAQHFFGVQIWGSTIYDDLNEFKEIYEDLECLKDNYGIYRSRAAAP
jgi:hypothetical protein